jgi:hypothetical protein
MRSKGHQQRLLLPDHRVFMLALEKASPAGGACGLAP